MALNDIKFEKINGGMGRTAPNEDVNSGLIMSLDGNITADDLAAFDSIAVDTVTLYVATLSYYEQLELQYNITKKEPTGTGAALNAIYAGNAIDYHVSEFFRMSPTGKLWLAVKLTGELTANELKAIQYYAEGSLRQIGIFTPTISDLADYQAAALALEGEHQPLSVIVAPSKGSLTLTSFTTGSSHIVKDRSNVSVLISCDLSTDVVAVLGDEHFAYCGAIGNCLGAVSAAAVHESISWVQKFPAGLKVPGFITGELLKEVETTNLNLINDNRYIFIRTHVGRAGNYYNDSFTLDVATSDYGFIENVRTMDKATRGIRTNLLPQLNAPLYVDPSTGKLSANTVAFLENEASKALEAMEAAGELSGYKAEIDPNQNVLATSEVEVQIKNVPVGVMRKVKVKIGYKTSI